MRLPVPAWIVLATALVAGEASAQPAPVPGEEPVILRVEVNGLRYHREAAIKALLESRESRRFDRQVLSEDIHRLNRTGYFSHIRHETTPIPGGIALVLTVVENDRIAAVDLVGVKQQDLKVLVDGLRLRAGDYYDPFKVKRDIEFLRQTYQGKGHHFVEVSASPPQPGPDGVTLRYTVVEGPPVTVAGVRFTGRPAVDAGELEDKMLMKPPGWLIRWLSSTDFVERALRDDLDRLKTYYRWEGWLDVIVTLEDLEFSADKTEVVPVIHIDEGKPYRVRNLAIQGNTLFATEDLLEAMRDLSDLDADAVPLRPGGPFSERALQSTRERLLDKYQERAYILAEIDVQRVYAVGAPEVALAFQIREHGKVFIERIVIQGNEKTRDVVIRRALGVAPGEEYNKVALERGIRRLNDLHYFEPRDGKPPVSFREEPGSAPDRRVLVVEVNEGPTGSIRFAGGYSTHFGVVGLIELTQRNFDIAKPPDGAGDLFGGDAFAGAGQYFQLQFQPGSRRTGFSVTFGEPYLFQEPVGFEMRGFRSVVRRIFEYMEDRRGGAIGLSRRFQDEQVTIGSRLRLENIDIGDLDLDASSDAREVEGLNLLRSMQPYVGVDTRDSKLQPTEGGSATASTEVVGRWLGGDFNFTKTRLEADYHLPVLSTSRKYRHVLSFGGTFGWVGPNLRDDDVPIFERFFAGGGGSGGLRGFSFRRVGPREDEDPIGGNAIALGQVEYGFPLYEQVIRGAFFVDAGDLESSVRDLAMNQVRISTGTGIRLMIPQLGGGAPLALYYGVPLRQEPGDRRRSVFFDIGFPF